MPNVSANSNAIYAFMVEAVRQRLVSNISAGTHTNHDGGNTPAEWWYDSGWTIRHRMATGMAVTGAGTTITLRLTYTIDTVDYP